MKPKPLIIGVLGKPIARRRRSPAPDDPVRAHLSRLDTVADMLAFLRRELGAWLDHAAADRLERRLAANAMPPAAAVMVIHTMAKGADTRRKEAAAPRLRPWAMVSRGVASTRNAGIRVTSEPDLAFSGAGT